MPTVVGVKLRNAAKPLLFDPSGLELSEGQSVVVTTDRGLEIGEIARGPYEVDKADVPGDLKPVERVASDDDRARLEELREKERVAMKAYRRLVAKHHLDLKPVDVEFLLDGDKAVFYFVAEERVDFRDLVRDLASEFAVRVDMRQVGVRDEARMVGGLGHCGETLCCVRFGGEFQPVSIRMAKEQDLPLNPQKISGLCGRLMCCLRYEYEAYKDFKGRAPKKNTCVETPKGDAKVVDLNTPRETVTMRLLEGGEYLTVPLAGMECGKGGGCPCKVRADALPAEPEPIAEMEPIVTLPPKAKAKAPAAESGAAESEASETQKPRRRRRGGGRGNKDTQAKPAAESEKPAGQPKGRQSGKGDSQKAEAGAANKPAQTGAAPANKPAQAGGEGEGAAKPAGRRRRRRRPGKPSSEQ